jgi:hypothetical protein
MERLSAATQRKIMGANAARLYGLAVG